VFQVLASRGCVFRCAYCYNSTWQREVYPGQRWYRTRSPASVVEELVVARERWDYQRVRFDDEVFATDPAWLDEFCRLYPREIGLPFDIFTEPKLVDEVALGRLRDAGLAAVNMGVQTTDRVAGALYDRRSRDEVVVEAARIFHRLGIRGHFQLIWDDPASTDADLARVFELVQSFPRPFDLYLFSLTVFPGSALDQRLVDEGRISRWDVEGLNTRTFFQHRVNLRYPRPVEHGFWLALCVLSANDWVHRPTLDRLARSRLLKRHPWPLIQAAQAASLHKMGLTAARMAWRGELTPTLVRRWLSLERLITS